MKFVDRLNELLSLQDGWYDDNKGIAPTEQLVQLVTAVVVHLLERNSLLEPQISPVPDGGIDLSWEHKGIYCTVGEEEFRIAQVKGKLPEDIHITEFSLIGKEEQQKTELICLKLISIFSEL